MTNTDGRGRTVLVMLVALAGLIYGGCQVGPASPSEPEQTDSAPTFTATDSAPTFTATVHDRTYLLNSVACILELPAATGGNGTLVYSLTPTVPDWNFDKIKRTLTVPTTTPGLWEMIYRVEDTDENTSSSDADVLKFTITITESGEDVQQPEGGISIRYQGCGNQVFVLNPEGQPLDDTRYTLVLDAASADVYLIATNTTARDLTPYIERLDASEREAPSHRRSVGIRNLSARIAPDSIELGVASVTEFNNNPPRPQAVSPSLDVMSNPVRSRQTVTEGARVTFYDTFDGESAIEVAATARRVVTDGTTTAISWIGDDDWGTCSGCLRQEMVDALAHRFLLPGERNDIYDWVSAVFGDPWGPHDLSFLIPAEYADEIHVLLYDLEGTGGFFPASDTYLRDPDSLDIRLKFSNERLMVYGDASVLATPDGPTWDISDHNPSYMMSTLAHEFQHMIHFYQKLVKHDFETVSEAWINEMASDLTEDLVADKLMRVARRGVAHDDPTAGEPGNERGRFPTYNYYNYLQATKWEYDAPLYRYYAINYALGTYLALTYGGAPLLGDIVQNDRSGIEAIEAAVAAQGHSVSFEDVLRDWAVANVLSDDTQAPHPYRYNSGTWSMSEAGGVTFRLGAVNLFNYRFHYGEGPNDYHDGPYSFSVAEFNDEGAQPPHSNRYAHLGRNTATVRLRVDAPVGNRITVVVKE